MEVDEPGQKPRPVAVDHPRPLALGHLARGVRAYADDEAALDHDVHFGVEGPCGVDRAHAAEDEDIAHEPDRRLIAINGPRVD